MLERLVEKAINAKLWVFSVTVAVIGFGLYSLLRLPIDAVPDITNVSVMVNAVTGALAPEEIERTVTFPIEAELAGLPGVEDIRSLSKYGLSQVIVVFNDSTDIYFARQLVFERLQAVREKLPNGIVPELGPVSTGLGEVFMYTLLPREGSALSKMDEKDRLRYLRTVQDFIVKPALKSIPGVAEVESNGGYKKEIHINVNPRKMEQNGITCSELIAALEGVGENIGGGYIQQKGQQIIVRTLGRVHSLDEIKNIPVKLNVFGRPIRIYELADVVEGHAQRLGAATYNGKEAVLGTVLMRIGENSRNVVRDIEKAIEELRFHDDVVIQTLYSRSFLVNATIRTVAKNLLEGGFLVVAVLFLVLGNIRAAFLTALAIPLSMLFAFTGMIVFGISASLMSLGAIDFGLIVDGSVVMIENIIRKTEEFGRNLSAHLVMSPSEKLSIIRDSTKEVVRPVFYGVIIIMIVYIPILSLSGIEGKMFKPMAATVLFALGASLLIALFLMPVATSFVMRSSRSKEKNFFQHIEMLYKPVLRFTLEHRFLTIAPTLVFGISAFAIFIFLGSDFIPKLDEGDMVIGLVRDTRISIDKSLQMQMKSDKVISKFKEVKHVFSRMGTPESATDPMGINFADTFVILEKDRTKWEIVNGKPRTRDELFAAIAKAIEEEVPGQEISMTQPIEMRFNEILEGSRADITLRIFGQNLEILYDLVNKGVVLMEKIPGAETVELDPLTALKKSAVLDVKLNYDAINRYGVNIRDVNHAFEIAMKGTVVGSLYEGDKSFPILVRLADEFRTSIADIGRIPITYPQGGSIPLSTLATLQMNDQITTIARSHARRYATISINLRDRDTMSFVEEAKRVISEKLNLPNGYFVEWGGQFKNLTSARRRLLIIIPIVLVVIFIILERIFKSIKQTLLVFNSIPFAITGGVFMLWFRDIPLSVSAEIGFIALTGIAILDGMVLVSFFNHLRDQGLSLRDAVEQGSLIRLRPVVMTSLVAALGFVPMAFNVGIGAEVQRPLATVVIGGMVSSTILTLLLLPTLYLWLERSKNFWDLLTFSESGDDYL